MLRITQIERGKRLYEEMLQQNAPKNEITGKAFEEYGVILLLINKKGALVDAHERLKDIKKPTWVILGEETLTWKELEGFLGKFTPEELKVIKVED